jgi:hypothetical protein
MMYRMVLWSNRPWLFSWELITRWIYGYDRIPLAFCMISPGASNHCLDWSLQLDSAQASAER